MIPFVPLSRAELTLGKQYAVCCPRESTPRQMPQVLDRESSSLTGKAWERAAVALPPAQYLLSPTPYFVFIHRTGKTQK